jgi:hypothetical protein
VSGVIFLTMEICVSPDKKCAIRALIAHPDNKNEESIEKLTKCKKSASETDSENVHNFYLKNCWKQ